MTLFPVATILATEKTEKFEGLFARMEFEVKHSIQSYKSTIFHDVMMVNIRCETRRMD